MCGVCGIGANRLAADTPDVVRRMMRVLYHRGPDGQGQAGGDGFSFGHTRLAIIDVEHGRQPMVTTDGRYTLVYNGEIYNYLELREELARRGVALRTHSDTEVLLELLALKGEAALEDLNGMFAFALHDRDDGSILLARDPFGIKPLYYTILPDGALVFASEIKAILEHQDVDARRNDAALHEYLTFQFCIGGHTLFEGIHKVEPGCLVRWSARSGLAGRRYWDVDFRVDTSETEQAFQQRLEVTVADAVRIQLRSDVSLGSHLSGGLDSSLLAVLAAQSIACPLHVFHGRFSEGPQYDESEYARCVARAIDGVYHEVVPTEHQFVEDMPRLIRFMDEPAAGPGLFPQYHVSRLAAADVKVVLGGQGGDELFGGYARYLVGYLEQSLKGAIFETQDEGHHVVTLDTIVPNLAVLQQYVPLMKSFWSEGLFEDMDRRYFRLIDRSPGVMKLLHPDLLATRDQCGVFAAFQKVFNHPDTSSYINKMTHFDLKTLLPALLQVEDRMSMAASLESRVPLLDRRIADLVTTAPPRRKFAGGRLKHSLKQAAAKVLPPEVANRKSKMGFPVPLSEWVQRSPVREFVSDTLLSRAARERGIFRPEAIDDLLTRSSTFGRELWGVLCLELWHDQFNVS